MRRMVGFQMVVALGIAGMAGCLQYSGPGSKRGPQSLEQGLTVLTAEVGHLALAYRNGPHVIYMEALRGKPTPEIYQQDPLSPQYEMDAMITDDTGFILFMSKGGDHYVNPEWGDSMKKQWASNKHREQSNEALFRVMTIAAETLYDDLRDQLGDELVRDLDPEIYSIYSFAINAHSEYLAATRQVQEGIGPQPTAPNDQPAAETTYGTEGPEDADWANGGEYRFRFELRSAEMDGIPGYSGGWHSATRRLAYNSCGTLVYIHENCNHGRCAHELSQYVAQSGLKPFLAGQLHAQSCNGPYAAGSDGDCDWLGSCGGAGHNCHDDTRVQLYNFVKMATLGGYSRWCNGHDDHTDISVDIWLVEQDQDGHPYYSSSCTRGYNWCP